MWIKICGITRIEDAVAVRDAGADAIGLNFFGGSKRFVTPDAARKIAQAVVDSDLQRVGVFVNAPPDAVAGVVEHAGLTTVQFHGDESVDDLVEFHGLCPQVPIIRAVRISAESAGDRLQEIEDLLQRVPLRAVLLDALVAGHYGGTGQVIDTDVVRLYSADGKRPPLILAGGLTPNNVGAAIQATSPWGVDTAGGVETAPGIKDSCSVRAFISAARAPQGRSERTDL